MKKIIIASFLMLSFSLSINAQSIKKNVVAKTKEVVNLTPKQAAKKDGVAISEFLGLDENLRTAFIALFEMKHNVMQSSSETVESRREMSRIVGLKIDATIDSKQLEKLRGNTALYNQLLSTDAIEPKK
jgi:cytosine/uracil/thiamine/allantoin permease